MPVSYIPSQLEAPARASLTLRASPSRLLLKDLKLAFSLVRWLPYIILPLRSDSGPPHLSNIQDVALHGTIFILTVSSAGLAARFAFVMPGSTLMVFTVACWASLMGLCFPLNYGNRVLKSAVNLDGYPEHLRERWIFVNGICAGTRLMQENLDMISTIFKRPVIGVHNRTYGIIFDLIECLVQRDFSYMTSDIRITYNNIKETLLDEEVDRVVLIAHSQGGIIIGAALDALYADVPASAWEKLEVYTFGCAANHFHNPPRYTACNGENCHAPNCNHLQRHTPAQKRQISVIEHYANQKDFVARLGVLQFVGQDHEENQYVGKVFTRLGEGGHFFCQHYLAPMFLGEAPEFLREVVEVEEGTAVRRAVGAEGEGVDGIVDGIAQSEGARGKTVMQLSRLWKYKDGKVPE